MYKSRHVSARDFPLLPGAIAFILPYGSVEPTLIEEAIKTWRSSGDDRSSYFIRRTSCSRARLSECKFARQTKGEDHTKPRRDTGSWLEERNEKSRIFSSRTGRSCERGDMRVTAPAPRFAALSSVLVDVARDTAAFSHVLSLLFSFSNVTQPSLISPAKGTCVWRYFPISRGKTARAIPRG